MDERQLKLKLTDGMLAGLEGLADRYQDATGTTCGVQEAVYRVILEKIGATGTHLLSIGDGTQTAPALACHHCGKPLTGRQTKWCCPAHKTRFYERKRALESGG